MAGRLIDLNQSGVRLPTDFVVDTNLLVVQFLGHVKSSRSQDQDRAATVFPSIAAGACLGYVTPQSIVELFHLYVRYWYEQELAANRPKYDRLLQSKFGRRRRFYWSDLYKIRESFMPQVSKDLEQLRLILLASGLFILEPRDLGWDSLESRFEENMIHYMDRFKIDTADATILMESERAGIDSIVTLDKDYRRATKDFQVLTWL